jgi:hypothetical protein
MCGCARQDAAFLASGFPGSLPGWGWRAARQVEGYAVSTERPTGVVVHAPMTIRPALIGWCALAVAWTTAATVYLYPALKEEVDEKRYIHRAEKLHTPVLPLECGQARGVENATSFERTSTRKGAG